MTPNTLTLALTAGLVLNALLLAFGQILFKLAADQVRSTEPLWLQLPTSPSFLAALTVYGLTTGLWIWILRQAPLQLAYPFVALAYFFVPVAAHFFLDEPLRWQTLLGAAFIAIGIVVSVYRQ